MKERTDKPVPVKPQADPPAEAPFEVWLKRRLDELFGEVANEPIPPEMLRIIEGDREK